MEYKQPDPKANLSYVKNLKIGIVSAGLSHLGEQEAAHSKLVRSEVEGARQELIDLGVESENIIQVEVPGSLEIPLMARSLIKSHSLDGVIGCALIVDGGIYRHEFVAQTSLDKLMEVSLETNTPIASCMLTPIMPKSPETQFEMLNKHLGGKGKESAGALVRQILQIQNIKQK